MLLCNYSRASYSCNQAKWVSCQKKKKKKNWGMFQKEFIFSSKNSLISTSVGMRCPFCLPVPCKMSQLSWTLISMCKEKDFLWKSDVHLCQVLMQNESPVKMRSTKMSLFIDHFDSSDILFQLRLFTISHTPCDIMTQLHIDSTLVSDFCDVSIYTDWTVSIYYWYLCFHISILNINPLDSAIAIK